MSYLKSLISEMRENGISKLVATASGGGDEGYVEGVELWDSEGGCELGEGLIDEDLVDDTMMEHDFDYYNGDGGELILTIDLNEGVVKWQPSCYETNLIEGDSTLLTLSDLEKE